jgi:pimeloyl-ACP methyl ester carboxylesterase
MKGRDDTAGAGMVHSGLRPDLRLRTPMIVAAWCLLVLAVLYGAALAALWFGQERLLFQPTPLDAAQAVSAEPDVQERFVDVPGARLALLELRRPDPKGVVFFLHGNAGNLQSWFVNLDFYRRANYDLVMPDFRGYGKSSGRIESEAQLHADMRAVWDTVATRYAGRRVVFFGRSLGSGLAARLATEVTPDLTLLVSPYRSMVAIAAQLYPWVPSFLLRYPLRTDAALPRVTSPVLLLHGEHDELIPLAHAEALRALAPRARLLVVPGAAHGDLQDFDSYRDAIAAALKAL